MRTPTGGPYSVWVGCNDNIISAHARSENGCGKCQFGGVKLSQDLENRAAHPYHEFLGIPLRGYDIKLLLLGLYPSSARASRRGPGGGV